MSRYRTPGRLGEPEFVAALGWAVWNFLYLEESIVRWLWLLRPDRSLTEWRKAKAFEKGIALGRESNTSVPSCRLTYVETSRPG